MLELGFQRTKEGTEQSEILVPKWNPEWVCVAWQGQGYVLDQCLSPMTVSLPWFLFQMWVLIVCAETVPCSVPSSLLMDMAWRLLQLRITKPFSLIQPYTINPSSLFICMLLVLFFTQLPATTSSLCSTLCNKHTQSQWCWDFSVREEAHQILVCVSLFFIFPLTQSGLTLETWKDVVK